MTSVRPKTIKIGPHKYDVLWSLESWKKYATKEQRETKVGMCLVDKGVILVNGWNQTKSQQQDTFLHEIVHACFAVIGFQHHESEMPSSKYDLEEIIVLILTPMLHMMLRDNPEAIAWLTSE